MTFAAVGNKNTAIRFINAENNFLSYLTERAGITEAEAVKVLALYRKMKVIKIDAVVGQWNVKHGAFLDADVIRRAAAEA